MFSFSDYEMGVSESARHPIADEETNKILARYSRQVKNLEMRAPSQLCTTAATQLVTSTVPAPTRFTRKTRTADRNQNEILLPPLLNLGDDNKLPVKFNARYDSVLFELMESDLHAAKAHISTKDMYLDC